MPSYEVDHIGIVVRDLERSIHAFAAMFGAVEVHRERFEESGTEEALLDFGASQVQLLCPGRPDSALASILESDGEALHHIAFRVADCNIALREAVALGATPMFEPRMGSRGSTVVFLSAGGPFPVLVELVQLADSSDACS
jgi:methylmalonyl-CoA/ethylmalonyl-CoA epimerase